MHKLVNLLSKLCPLSHHIIAFVTSIKNAVYECCAVDDSSRFDSLLREMFQILDDKLVGPEDWPFYVERHLDEKGSVALH